MAGDSNGRVTLLGEDGDLLPIDVNSNSLQDLLASGGASPAPWLSAASATRSAPTRRWVLARSTCPSVRCPTARRWMVGPSS
jgi:hypothetical protein